MSESSVFCTTCTRYWRPAQIYRLNKRKRAPDGGPSGMCKECHNAVCRRHRERVFADPEAHERYKAMHRDGKRRRREAMTEEERRARAHANYVRWPTKREKAREYSRAWRARNLERVRAAQRDYARRKRETCREALNAQHRENAARRKARRFAQRIAAARGDTRGA